MSQNQQQVINPAGAPSYPQSALRFTLYRFGVVLLALFLIIIGKSQLPSDQVPCIQDTILQFLTPITTFYFQQQVFGRVLVTFLHLMVDIQLVGMVGHWYIFGKSLRYPLALTILGIIKIFLNVLFKTKTINESFIKSGYIPSITFGQNFQNSYFFSAICALLIINLYQMMQLEKYILFKIQIGVILVCLFLLLSLKLNFFMDVITGFVFGHVVYSNILKYQDLLNSKTIGLYYKIIGHKKQID